MSGVVWAISAGISFGLFQAVNRRANRDADAYHATFGLLVVATSALVIVTLVTGEVAHFSDSSLTALGYFAAAGVIHFVFGWTFLALSQQRIGAARTGAIVASTPLTASFLAAVVLGEPLGVTMLVGVLLVVAGVSLLSLRASSGAFQGPVSWFALAAATSWGISPLFIRWGIEGFPHPVGGVTVGMAGATAAYALALSIGRRGLADRPTVRAWRWLVPAGLFVAYGITAQWKAFELTLVAIAATLMQLSVPTVILVAPLVIGGTAERITARLVIGSLAVMGGSILVVLAG